MSLFRPLHACVLLYLYVCVCMCVTAGINADQWQLVLPKKKKFFLYSASVIAAYCFLFGVWTFVCCSLVFASLLFIVWRNKFTNCAEQSKQIAKIWCHWLTIPFPFPMRLLLLLMMMMGRHWIFSCDSRGREREWEREIGEEESDRGSLVF